MIGKIALLISFILIVGLTGLVYADYRNGQAVENDKDATISELQSRATDQQLLIEKLKQEKCINETLLYDLQNEDTKELVERPVCDVMDFKGSPAVEFLP